LANQTPDDALTGVSTLDPVILAAEADAAWEVMQHHARRCETLAHELGCETRVRRFYQIKAFGFDQLAAQMKALNVQIRNAAQVFDTLNEIISKTQQEVDKELEAQNKGAPH
jgi:hypothetical protein